MEELKHTLLDIYSWKLRRRYERRAFILDSNFTNFRHVCHLLSLFPSLFAPRMPLDVLFVRACVCVLSIRISTRSARRKNENCMSATVPLRGFLRRMNLITSWKAS